MTGRVLLYGVDDEGKGIVIVADDFGYSPEILLTMRDAALMPVGLGSVSSWLEGAFEWLNRNGKNVVAVVSSVAGVLGITGKLGAVACVRDCGTLWRVENAGSAGVRVTAAVGTQCVGKIPVDAAKIPGWVSPCSGVNAIPYAAGRVAGAVPVWMWVAGAAGAVAVVWAVSK